MEGVDVPLMNVNITLTDLSTTLSDALIIVLLRKKRNPFLEALPNFIYSMPAQLLILSITLTLLGSLLIHLLFTIRYHVPLSKLNYILQITAVIFALSNTCGNLAILIGSLQERAQKPPYMFLYIEVVIPPSQWSKPTLAAWLILQGMVTLSVHITHIQFLTLLFPSGLEQKLILGLLGPLAFASSFLSFVDLSDVPAVVDLGEAVRDTCDSSLTLLYTLAIFGWSLTLNRERAWKSEGGTVAFGIVALVLGTCGTALNFLEIREERLKWLSGVVDCILLWQSWVSLWWWVGSGMYDGEVADLTKRIKKAERLENRRLAKLGLLKNSTTAGGEDTVVGVGSSLRGISGAVRRRITGSGSRRGSNATAQQPEEIELQTFNNNATTTSPLSSTPLSSSPPPSTITSTPIINSLHPIPAFFITPILSLFSPFLNRLKKAHETTIKAKAAEIPLPHNLERTREAKTWGIRSLINRGRRDLDERRAEAGYGQGGLTRGGEVTGGEVRIEGRRAGFEIDGAVQLEDEDEDNEGEDETQWVDENVVSSDRRKEEVQNNTSWGLKNLIRRWRLKDVQTY